MSSLQMVGLQTDRGDRRVELAKRDQRNGSAVGAGAVLAGTGFIAGGVPGAHPDSLSLASARQGSKYNAARHLVSGGSGGIFGYRSDAHRRFLNHQLDDEKAHGGSRTSMVNHFLRGQGTGKIAPERQVVRHMNFGRGLGNAALAAGTGLMAGASIQRRQRTSVKKLATRDDYRSNQLVGGGAATAAVAGGGSQVLRSQGRKWAKRSATSLNEAQRINPNLGGHTARPTRSGVPDIKPHLHSDEIAGDHERIFARHSVRDTERAGKFRGAAIQQRYFANTYGKQSLLARKVAVGGAIVAGTGLGTKQVELKPRGVSKVAITMSDSEAKRIAGKYDTRGPLPKTLSRDQRMKAYEGRYVASGGRKAEKWKRRSTLAEASRNVGLAGATGAGMAILARRGRHTGPALARIPGARKVGVHHLETAGLISGTAGGASELYGEHARARRASYANSPAGVAASALSRMRAYTPEH